MSDLSRELGVTLSAMTQIANRLERAGMVTRGFEDSDRRIRLLQLTPRAERMLRVRRENQIHRIALLLARMESADRDKTLAALDALRLVAETNATCDASQPALTAHVNE